jgi:hypothetical protein
MGKALLRAGMNRFVPWCSPKITSSRFQTLQRKKMEGTMPETQPAQANGDARSTKQSEEQDAQLAEMVLKHQGPHLRAILADTKKAEVLDFEIGKAVASVLKWFPQK